MARQMVINYGFSDIGPWSLLDQNAQSQDMIMRMMARNSTSESLQRKIDEAVKKIADEAYTLALKHVRYGKKGLCPVYCDTMFFDRQETLMMCLLCPFCVCN